ncbi:MAG: hypothetical protein SVN78_07295 [Deferribacterota bacterium]|nr:hypothetical protein [Deferribacterota bacterium]
MITTVNEKILLCAIFDKNRVKPLWFYYSGRKIVIKEICYKWKEREGDNVIYKFTVTDGSSIYEIAYSLNTLQWYLIAVDEGAVI